MKHCVVTLVFLAIGFFGAFAQEKTGGAKFKFKNGDTYDFGTVKEGGIIEHVFEFTNVGTEPLIIQEAAGSCSCTKPEWPKEPILPGKTGKIKVGYNTQGRPYPFDKDIYITSNAIVPDGRNRYELHIKGTVEAAPTSSVPENSSMIRTTH